MSTVCRTMARSLLVLILICVLSCSTSPKRHSQPKFKELPVPVTVEPETAAAVPETPSKLEPPSPTSEPRFYIHRVRWPGETLSIIAKWYTGRLKNWKVLSNANPTLDLNRIVIGANNPVQRSCSGLLKKISHP
ncbi:MAG: LysM peptidoglycan-binding domain-containing protein [Deltaproteobacteria bacterium]|nr:LysM peptidoglycan-binding domain-containing protein [Deltaproteobacteria bacterium]